MKMKTHLVSNWWPFAANSGQTWLPKKPFSHATNKSPFCHLTLTVPFYLHFRGHFVTSKHQVRGHFVIWLLLHRFTYIFDATLSPVSTKFVAYFNQIRGHFETKFEIILLKPSMVKSAVKEIEFVHLNFAKFELFYSISRLSSHRGHEVHFDFHPRNLFPQTVKTPLGRRRLSLTTFHKSRTNVKTFYKCWTNSHQFHKCQTNLDTLHKCCTKFFFK